VQIVITDNHTLRLTQVYELHEEVLDEHFRVKDPQAHHKLSMRRGYWDGYYRFYNSKNQTLARGYLKDLIELCVKNDFPFEIIDKRPKSKYPVPAPGSFDNQLIDAEIKGNKIVAHDHQMRCWDAVCKASQHPIYEVCTHFHPTGGGKSLMMAGIVKLIRCPTVIITEQSIVLNQIVNSLKLFNVVHHDDIGEFYSGKMPEGNVVCVGSIAALQTPVKPQLAKFNVRMATLKKDFNSMYAKDYDKLKTIMSVKAIDAWRRSCVLDDVGELYDKNLKKDKKNRIDLSDLIPKHKDWDEVVKDIAINIGFWIKKDKKKLEKLIGSFNVATWEETEHVSSSYHKELKNAMAIWYTFERKKYFDIARKAYHTRLDKCRELQNMVSECELLIVDEMDNAASANYTPLFTEWFQGRYVHGFSGTPYDPDKPVEEMRLRGYFGPVSSKSERRELEEIGQIQPVKYFMIQFGDVDQQDKTAFDVAERDVIIDNCDFHSVIKKSVLNWPDESHLIIVDTTNVEDLGKRLNEIIPNSVFVYGKVSPKKRQAMIRDFENGDINVLIVSKVGKRGMDLGGGAHNMHIIGGGKNQSNFDQIIGRGVRNNDRGWARVFDYYYTGNYYLLRHSRRRLNFICQMGYQAKIIFGTKVIEAQKFISSRYRIPKEFIS